MEGGQKKHMQANHPFTLWTIPCPSFPREKVFSSPRPGVCSFDRPGTPGAGGWAMVGIPRWSARELSWEKWWVLVKKICWWRRWGCFRLACFLVGSGLVRWECFHPYMLHQLSGVWSDSSHLRLNTYWYHLSDKAHGPWVQEDLSQELVLTCFNCWFDIFIYFLALR